MRLLLVDDEYLAVEGIRNRVQAMKIPGIDTIQCAYSADQVREIYKKQPIDIMVTDIAMPGESGLDLIRWVRENGYDTICLLLTGHEDFSYARTAISLQCFRYILKPVDMDELVSGIRDAVQERGKELDSPSPADRRSIFWHELFSGMLIPGSPQIQLRLHELQLPEDFTSRQFWFCLLVIQQRAVQYVDILQRIPFADLRDALQSFCHEHQSQIDLVAIDADRYMLIADPESIGDLHGGPDSALMEFMLLLSSRWENSRFVFYQFDQMPGGSAFYICELLRRYAASYVSTESAVILVSELEDGAIRDNSAGIPADQWFEWLSAGRTDDILKDLRRVLHQSGTLYSVRRLTAVYYEILNLAFRVLAEHAIGVSTLSTHADLASATSSPEALLAWAARIFSNVQTALHAGAAADTVMSGVKRYIQDHLQEETLSRNTIAAAVHVSPDYLSYLFHKEEGTVLSSYIATLRIDAAKKLLRTTGDSLQEISAAVGFGNDAYFFRQFKKLTGQTPSAYRNSMQAAKHKS